MRKILFGALSSALLLSCGDLKKNENPRSVQKKEWNAANDPSIMDTSTLSQHKYERKFDVIPLEATLPTLPWSDYYWPSDHGGLTYRWNYNTDNTNVTVRYPILTKDQVFNFDLKILSPTEKFDIYMGRYNFPYTRVERQRTDVMSRPRPSWEGLCDNWAVATLFFKQPGPVSLKGRGGIEVPFGSSDVKALLIHFLKDADAETYFLGTRCEEDISELARRLNARTISRNEYLNRLESCAGVNPGAFHIVLANQIWKKKEGFVADVDWTYEVWNQPVFGYKSTIVSDKKTKSPGAAPATVREVELKTSMRYIEEKEQSWNITSETGEMEAEYHYRLELDKNGIIIGGAWISEARPDFLWKQEMPTFYGQDFLAIKEIYEASIGGEKMAPHRNIANHPLRRVARRIFH